MKKLIIPPKLNEGDKVAFISISGGRAGVRAFYGPNVLTPIAQPGKLDEDPEDVISWEPGTGYKVLQGSGKVRGHVIPVCGGPLWQIMGAGI